MAGTIEQRIFDAFPPSSVSITLNFLRNALPFVDPESIRSALRRLIAQGIVERVTLRRTYRLVHGAQRPADKRGGSYGK